MSTNQKKDFDPSAFAQQSGLSEDEILDVKEAFDLFDADKSGQININELKAAMSQLGLEAKQESLFQWYETMDTDQSGQIDFQEFLDMMVKNIVEKTSRDDLAKVFKLFDEDSSGYISLDNLRKVAADLGEVLEDYEFNAMLEKASSNGDQNVSFEDFYILMTKKTFRE